MLLWTKQNRGNTTDLDVYSNVLDMHYGLNF